MRLTFATALILTSGLSPAVMHASGPGSARPYWTEWNLEVYSHYCSLASKHHSQRQPYYPDLFVSFRVATKSLTSPSPPPDVGQVTFGIQTYLPNVPKKNAPLNRVERISVDGMELTRTDQGQHEAILRTFGLFGNDAAKLLSSFRKYDHTDEIYMELTLENGQVVSPRLLLRHHFDTRARMLLVCTDPELVHSP